MKEKKQKVKMCTVCDKLLKEGFFADEKEASAWVMMKRVLVNDQLVWSLYEKIPQNGIVRIKEYYKKQYVNKGGFKLESAIKNFNIPVNNKIILDCGASTGGFTDCWLHYGARLVYAVDVGYGQLAGKLAIDPRVINMERTNLSDERLKMLDPKPDVISLDLSYLSLKNALSYCKGILKDKGLMVCLIKPIYEVESSEIRRSGNINQKDILRDILLNICQFYLDNGLNILGIINSPIRGNNGTLEYFISVYWNYDDFLNINSSYEDYVEIAINNSFEIESYKKM